MVQLLIWLFLLVKTSWGKQSKAYNNITPISHLKSPDLDIQQETLTEIISCVSFQRNAHLWLPSHSVGCSGRAEAIISLGIPRKALPYFAWANLLRATECTKSAPGAHVPIIIMYICNASASLFWEVACQWTLRDKRLEHAASRR